MQPIDISANERDLKTYFALFQMYQDKDTLMHLQFKKTALKLIREFNEKILVVCA